MEKNIELNETHTRVRSKCVRQNTEELELGFCFATSEDIHPHMGIPGREAVPILKSPQDPWEQRNVWHPGTPENTRGKSRIDLEETYPTYVSKARMSRRVETLRDKNSGVTRDRFGNTNRQGEILISESTARPQECWNKGRSEN